MTHHKAVSPVWNATTSVSVHVPYRRVLPVADDLFQVMAWVEQEVFSPLIPVHHHGAVNVHTKHKQMIDLTRWSRPHSSHVAGYVTKRTPLEDFQGFLSAYCYAQLRQALLDLWSIDASWHNRKNICSEPRWSSNTECENYVNMCEHSCQALVQLHTHFLPSLFLSRPLNVSRNFFSCSFRYLVNSLKSRLPSLLWSPDNRIFCKDENKSNWSCGYTHPDGPTGISRIRQDLKVLPT